MATTGLRMGTPAGRLALAATVVGSSAAFLDTSVVNVALPAIGRDLGGGLATAQWVVDGYLLTLGSLVLVGGSLGDLLGRRRVYEWGLVLFVLASVACGLAPSPAVLIASRAVQGVGAALLVPGSLAILASCFARGDRGRAIGAWSGLTTVVTAAGPVVGGLLVASSSSGWRWVFLVNVPVVAVALVLSRRGIADIPGTREPGPLRGQLDVLGGVLAVVGLGLLVGPLIEIERLDALLVILLVLTGAGVLTAFALVERRRTRTRHPPPMLPTDLFAVRALTVANLVTLAVYGALSVGFLLLTVVLQVGLGYTAWQAGLAGLPVTLLLAGFSSRVGGLVPRVGARLLLTAGGAVIAVGVLLLSTIAPGTSYVTGVLPGVVVFGAGLALVVAPVTTTAVGHVSAQTSGAASGVNNAVARVAGLVAVAFVPWLGGLTGAALSGGPGLVEGYQRSMLVVAGLLVLGAAVAWFGLAGTSADGRAPDDPDA
ncbi:MAG: MFS transporter [Frankiales bacterium]|nr:MFS transporter [Frankiales bacterium]